MKKLWNGLIHLLYPRLCACCNDTLQLGETAICISCLYEMPRTRFHDMDNNPVSQLFWGKFKFEQASALFFYNKGNQYQNLIHSLKYRGQTNIGSFLGAELGQELKNSKYFKNIDYVIPVPLHKKRLKERGYNQSSFIAEGLATSLNTKTDSQNLKRKKYTSTQTKKSKFERWLNMESVFELENTQLFENKHILLIDDIITTGSTIESCALALQKVKGLKLSIACLGIA
jgi:ComF family protein